jgi:hypothetical protein
MQGGGARIFYRYTYSYHCCLPVHIVWTCTMHPCEYNHILLVEYILMKPSLPPSFLHLSIPPSLSSSLTQFVKLTFWGIALAQIDFFGIAFCQVDFFGITLCQVDFLRIALCQVDSLGIALCQSWLFGDHTLSSWLFGDHTLSKLTFWDRTLSSWLFGDRTLSSWLFGDRTLSSWLFGDRTLSSWLFGDSTLLSWLLGDHILSSWFFGDRTLSSWLFGDHTLSKLTFWGSHFVKLTFWGSHFVKLTFWGSYFVKLAFWGSPLGSPFWIFQKCAFLRPWRTSDTCLFFQIAWFCTFFSKICTKCCAVFFCLALGLRYGTWACAKVSQWGWLLNFLKIFISKKTARGLCKGGGRIFDNHCISVCLL